MLSQASLSPESLRQIEKEAAKYPADRRSSAIMAALTIAQDEHQYLTKELIEHVAQIIGIPPVRAYEVATFYSMYQHQPCGENVIKVCTNISCMLRGADGIVAHLENRLGIKLGEVTPDGKIGLQEVECLAACVGAPMLQLNKQYVENLTPESINEMLESLS